MKEPPNQFVKKVELKDFISFIPLSPSSLCLVIIENDIQLIPLLWSSLSHQNLIIDEVNYWQKVDCSLKIGIIKEGYACMIDFNSTSLPAWDKD